MGTETTEIRCPGKEKQVQKSKQEIQAATKSY